MYKKLLKTISICTILVLMGVSCSALNRPKEKDSNEKKNVKVGVLAPLSGDVAVYGEAIKKGLKLYQEESKSNIKFVYADTRCKNSKAVSGIKKLININKVRAIVGAGCSGSTIAAAPVVNQNSVPMISPMSTSHSVSDAGQYVFRTISSDKGQARFGAKIVKDKGYNRLAILYSKGDYGSSYHSVLKEAFKKKGGKIVEIESFEKSDTDIRTQITKIKDKNPQAVYLISNSSASAVAALQQMQELGLNDVALFGSADLKLPGFIKGAKKVAEGIIVPSFPEGNSSFSKKFKDKYGEQPGQVNPQAYDALKAIDIALEIGADSSKEIKKALYYIEFEGASGVIDFDNKGNVPENYKQYKLINGKFRQI